MSRSRNRRRPSPWPTRATGRWRFLADASAALDTSIEYEQTLANTVRLAVPEVADYCVVILLGEDGSTRWADSAHRDPAKRALLESLRGYVPPPSPEHPDPEGAADRAAAARHGRRQRDPEWWDGAQLGIVRALAPASLIAVPMIARWRTLGAILFAVTAESGRRYRDHDLGLAADVGRRAAFAIDHALLYEAARRAAKERDELMAVVAHDLKNPLNTIQLAVKVLQEDGPCGDGEKGAIDRHALGAVQRAADRMYRLIHDLLELSRADAGRLWIRPAAADAEAMLRDAVDTHCEIAAAKSIRLEATAEESLPSVLADRERIAQVFSNLIGNALKFTPSGGRVSVRGWRAPDGRAVRRRRHGTRHTARGPGTRLRPLLAGAEHVADGDRPRPFHCEVHRGRAWRQHSRRKHARPGEPLRIQPSDDRRNDGQAEPGTPGAGQDRHWVTACRQP